MIDIAHRVILIENIFKNNGAHFIAGEGKKQNSESEKAAQGRAAKEGWKSGQEQPIGGGGNPGPGLGLIEALLEPESQPEVMDWQFKRKKKKKKRPRVSPD